MIIYNGVKYATNDDELIDSLFKKGGTLNTLYDIKIRKTDIRFFIDKDYGVGINANGVVFKFSRLDNKSFWYQICLDNQAEKTIKKYARDIGFII